MQQRYNVNFINYLNKINFMGYNVNEDGTVTRHGSSFSDNNQPQRQKKEAGCFAIICSFLFPIVGLILYFTKKDDVKNPEAYLIAAGISFAIGFISTLASA